MPATHMSYNDFKSSTYEMFKGTQAKNQTEYTGYVSDFWAMIENLNKDQAAYFESHSVQSMSGLSYSAMSLDMWIYCRIHFLLQQEMQTLCQG